MDKNNVDETYQERYKEYFNYYKKNKWSWEDITYYLKKNWVDYEEYSFEEFIEKCKTDEKFNKKWGIIK